MRIPRAISGCTVGLALIQTIACATPLVHERWSGRAEIASIDFRVGDAGSASGAESSLAVDWRTVDRSGSARGGTFSFDADTCEAGSFFVPLRAERIPLEGDRWVSIPFSQIPLGEPKGEIAACEFALVLIEAGPGFDPKFALGGARGPNRRFVALPPRRHRWVPLYPLAVVFDVTIGAAAVFVAGQQGATYEGTL